MPAVKTTELLGVVHSKTTIPIILIGLAFIQVARFVLPKCDSMTAFSRLILFAQIYLWSMASVSPTAGANALRPRFVGCVLTALAGDCLGAKFEQNEFYGGFPDERAAVKLRGDVVEWVRTQSTDSASKKGMTTRSSSGVHQLRYTDDSAMHLSLLRSLTANRGTLNTHDLAKRFAESFFSDPNRGYGRAIGQVFQQFRNVDYQDDSSAFASRQFDGSGSFGNGAAMRAAAVGLACARHTDEQCVKMAVEQARQTHTHADAVLGSVVQSLAVRSLMDHKWTKNGGIAKKRPEFIDHLDNTVQKQLRTNEILQQAVGKEYSISENHYTRSFSAMRELLITECADPVDVVDNLGNSIGAAQSQPTAIYAFLRGATPIDGIPFSNSLLRTLAFSFSLGGDTDTIGTMAGALAGTYYYAVDETLPNELVDKLEAAREFRELAENLFEAVHQ